MKELKDKVAVITGAGSGIGQATAFALAARGATVAVCDLRADAAKDTVERILGSGGRASAHEVDVASRQAVEALRDAVLERHRVVDVLVNNAGVGIDSVPTLDTGLEVYRAVLDINLWGVIHGVKAFLPALVARPEASIVNTGSFAALMGMTMMSPYNISKFGVRGFSEALQMEFNGSALTVTMVYPGATKTGLMVNSSTIDEAKRDQMNTSLMSSKTAIAPERVAAAIVDGIRRKKKRVLAGNDTKVIDKIVRLMPGGYPRIMAPQLKKFIDKTLH